MSNRLYNTGIQYTVQYKSTITICYRLIWCICDLMPDILEFFA